MFVFAITDILLGVILAFSAIFLWSKNYTKRYFFFIVLAALFNYLYSFFRVLEHINMIPNDWYLSLGSFPIIKYLVVSFSMLFFIMGLVMLANENKKLY